MIKKFLIITASDSKYGDFLINHWLKSLLPNINKRLVDIAVLDYGLTSEQRKKILKKAKIIKCLRDGNITNIRYRDMLSFLKKNNYQQIMSVDGGDLIFQDNIMNIFDEHKTEIRVVSEGLMIPSHESALLSKPFNKDMANNILKTLRNKKLFNGGLVIAPISEFIKLCRFQLKYTKKPELFGLDQVLLNYYLYKNKNFFELNNTYNFVIATARHKFKIKQGIFLNAQGKPITIVHNTGGSDTWRPIRNFGYGKDRNKIRPFVYYWLRFGYNLSFITIPVMRFFLKIVGPKK